MYLSPLVEFRWALKNSTTSLAGRQPKRLFLSLIERANTPPPWCRVSLQQVQIILVSPLRANLVESMSRAQFSMESLAIRGTLLTLLAVHRAVVQQEWQVDYSRSVPVAMVVAAFASLLDSLALSA
jgi:hypothetical protein